MNAEINKLLAEFDTGQAKLNAYIEKLEVEALRKKPDPVLAARVEACLEMLRKLGHEG